MNTIEDMFDVMLDQATDAYLAKLPGLAEHRADVRRLIEDVMLQTTLNVRTEVGMGIALKISQMFDEKKMFQDAPPPEVLAHIESDPIKAFRGAVASTQAMAVTMAIGIATGELKIPQMEETLREAAATTPNPTPNAPGSNFKN